MLEVYCLVDPTVHPDLAPCLWTGSVLVTLWSFLWRTVLFFCCRIQLCDILDLFLQFICFELQFLFTSIYLRHYFYTFAAAWNVKMILPYSTWHLMSRANVMKTAAELRALILNSRAKVWPGGDLGLGNKLYHQKVQARDCHLMYINVFRPVPLQQRAKWVIYLNVAN